MKDELCLNHRHSRTADCCGVDVTHLCKTASYTSEFPGLGDVSLMLARCDSSFLKVSATKLMSAFVAGEEANKSKQETNL